MARLVGVLHGEEFAGLHPVARAAYAVHALTHVGPFAAGNGRVARALAAVPLLGAASIPLLVPARSGSAYRAALAAAEAGEPAALVVVVARCCADLVDLAVELRAAAGSPAQATALQRWRARVLAAHRLHAMVPGCVEQALARHRRRSDLGWMSRLEGTAVVAVGSRADDPRFDVAPVAVRVPLVDGTVVEETLAVDAHPVAGGGDAVVLRAESAQLGIEVRPADVAPPLSAAFARRLDALVDRVVAAFAVRVAAEDERG